MKIKTKHLAIALVILSAAMVMVPLTLHEIHNVGFFSGLWHGFTFVLRLVFWASGHCQLITGDGFLYFFGLFFGLMSIVSITLSKVK